MRKSFTYNGQRYYIRAENETEYEVKKALKLKELEEDKLIESNMLVRDWAEEWLPTYKTGVCEDKTYEDYETRLNKHILPEIGHLRLKDVKAIHIQKIYKKISHLSQSRIDKITQCVNQLFRSAVANELINSNPAEHAVKPHGTKGSHRPLTDEERNTILRVANYHKHGIWVKIMLFCGLRTGETARVKITHFDFKKGVLFIDGTKSDNAARTVPVPDDILQEVKSLKKDPFEYLFLNERGNALNSQNFVRMWKGVKRAMHIEMGGKIYRNQVIPPLMVADDLTPYCLRHTFCTDLQDAGVPINVAKELMGHSDISLTAEIYTHYTERAFNNAADLLKEYRKVAR